MGIDGSIFRVISYVDGWEKYGVSSKGLEILAELIIKKEVSLALQKTSRALLVSLLL